MNGSTPEKTSKMSNSLPTVIVTGGAGFIGSALCRYLVGGRLPKVINMDTRA
jgi:nucleoside-diphosphate-sugar epimerase